MLASRVDPDLPLARWRVRGHLAEIHAADLRFTAAEVTTFLKGALGEGLTEAGETWSMLETSDDDIHHVTGHPGRPDELWLALGWAALKKRAAEGWAPLSDRAARRSVPPGSGSR